MNAPPTYAVHGELHADGKTVVMFGTGDVKQAMGRLALLTPTMSATTPPGAIQTPLSWPLLVELAHELGQSWVPGPRLQAWLMAQVAKRNVLPPLSVKVNQGAPDPRDYQVAGAEIIAADGSGLVFDDPGTGKTLTTLLGLMELRARGHLPLAGAILVVCPNSVMDAWVAAAHRWTDLRAKAWRGSPTTRARLLRSRHDLYVVSYGTVIRDADPLRERHPLLLQLAPVAVVIDETHKIKNQNSEQSKGVRRLAKQAKTVIPLSGTPITHHTGDLWATLNALNPRAWPSKERYEARYLDSVPLDYSSDVLGLNKLREPEFRMTLQGQYRRLSKADVLSELPPKVYSVREVELPAAARKAYNQMKTDMLAQLEDGQEIPAMTVLSQLTHLLQLSCSAADVSFTYTTETDEYGNDYEKEHVHVTLKEHCWKADAVMEVLEERPGKQSVVFAPSRQLIELCGARAAAAGYRVGYIVGGQSAKARTAVVDDFQAGQLDVICATTAAGGVGITLTAASTVIFAQRPWSFVEASQAEDRCHRIGSEIHDSIEIIDIVAVKTVDSEVRRTLEGKAGALAELLEDPRVLAQCLGGLR